MKLSNQKIRELVVDPGFISPEDFELALQEAESGELELIDHLIKKDLIKDEELGQLIANEFGYRFINLKKTRIDPKIITSIPQEVARTKLVIAYSKDNNQIKVAMNDPHDLETRHLVEKKFGSYIKVYYATKKDIKAALTHYKKSLKYEFSKLLKKLKNKELSRQETDQVTVDIVDMLINYGYQSRASDIHIEPYAKKIGIRFRIDGIMHDVLEIPKNLSELIITRIKILAKMRIDEHRATQDGKMRHKIKNETIDVRVSSVPVTQGENIVMRLLSSKNRQFDLVSLGLLNKDLAKVKKSIKNPNGMILVTGPTGSGKTTTLYAVLKILNKREVNIATIEDPVEYDIEGVSQIQVNKKANLTFAKGLRSIVRQDPDIIVVGEIRDEETAGIAVNSALTGHLVLSTLHTNDAPTALPRLLDMKVEPFLVSSTVNVIIAQRLVRKICEQCRESQYLSVDDLKGKIPDELIKKYIKGKKKIHCYHGNGNCKACGDTGYSGRIGIFEVLTMTEEIKKLVVKNASSNEIMNVAKAGGMTTMLEDGMDKVINGITTIEELIRVTKS